MLVPTESVIATRCPNCGKANPVVFSVFSSKKTPVHANCECGTRLLTIRTPDYRRFWLDYHCPLCESQHVLSLRREQFFVSEAKPFFCADTGLVAGYVGPEKQVRQALSWKNKSVEQIAKELGFNDYFTNSSVMYRVLEHIYRMAVEGKLNCSCGSKNLEMEIFPDSLELRCEKCSASKTIMGLTEQDLQILNYDQMRIVPAKVYPLKWHN